MVNGKDIHVLELSALRQPELVPMLNGLGELDLRQFDYVAVHAPSEFSAEDESNITDKLSGVCSRGYAVGFPFSGPWTEVFNSDVYDNWVNPVVAGNAGGVSASGPPLHGLPASASIVIPANGLVVFAHT